MRRGREMNASHAPHTIGVLCLEVPPDLFPRSVADPATFGGVPVLYETVKGAWVDEITTSDPKLLQPAIDAAKALEERGATFLISNCGFFIHYKRDIEPHISIPAAISSLLWLPFLNAIRLPGKKIFVVTYDADKLTDKHLTDAFPAINRDDLIVAGLQGTKTWKDAGLKDATYDYDQIWSDLRQLIEGVVAEHPEIQVILLECATLCPFVPLVKQHFGLPTFDFVSLAECLMAAGDQR
jgi:hypothetical protein